MSSLRRFGCLVSLTSLLAACSGASDPPPSRASGAAAGSAATTTDGGGGTSASGGAVPTWHADIAPLVSARCQGCHQAGGIAPFSLETYAQAKMWSSSFGAVLQNGTMPPFLAAETDGCKPRLGFKDDLRLSAAQIDLFARWNDAGCPEGDAATAAPLPAPPDLELKGAEVEVKIPAPVTIEGPGDKFICFSLAPDLTPLEPTGAVGAVLGDRALIDGAQVRPGNSAIVHHVLVYTDESGKSASLAGDKGYYDCFGGPQLDAPDLVMAWAPGGTPVTAPPGVAISIPSSGRLVMQVHYHPTGSPQTDAETSVQLRGFGSEVPDYVGSLTLIGNFRRQDADSTGLQPGPDDSGAKPEFRIPAGVTGHTESMLYKVPQGSADYRIWAVGTHMHYVGTDMRIGVKHAAPGSDPADECLLETPRWDFNWQRGYLYDAPIDQAPVVRGGDLIDLRCTYDNSMQNPFVAAALGEQGLSAPRDVTLGEQTLDEMCLGVFGIAQKVSDLLK